MDVVISCMPESKHVQEMAARLSGAMRRPGALWIDCTSGVPERSREIAATLASQGIGFVDAPVSGGPQGAAAGQLAIMVGGEDADVARALPYLPGLKGSIGEGPNHSNHSNHSNYSNSFKIGFFGIFP